MRRCLPLLVKKRRRCPGHTCSTIFSSSDLFSILQEQIPRAPAQLGWRSSMGLVCTRGLPCSGMRAEDRLRLGSLTHG